MPLTSLRRFAPVVLLCIAAFFAARDAIAQPVKLELRPRSGDTILLRIQQQTELLGTMLRSSRESKVTIKTSMLMFARAIVQRSDDSGAVVMALTDSIRMTSTAPEPPDLKALQKAIEGSRVYMKVHPDGSSELIKADAALGSLIRTLIADMPSTLPKDAIEVGATWQRVVNVPLGDGVGIQSVKTTFRFDSLSAGKEIAFISMRGVIVEATSHPAASAQPGTTGDMNGHMMLDRRRGWIIDSIATITLNTIIRRPIESKLPPMNMQIRITQQMRTLNGY